MRGKGVGVGSAVIHFTVLAGTFFLLCGHKADRRGHWGRLLAPVPCRSHMVKTRMRGVRRERERKFWHKVILLFSFVLSLSFPGSACSSTSSLILHVSFSLQLQLKPCPSTGPSVHPSVLSPFSLLHPLSRLSLLSDRQSYPPGRFLSAGLPQQRCSVMWNLIFSPPKPNPWPLQSSHNHRGRGAKAGKGGFWEKVKFPKTLLRMHVCVRLCMHDSVHAPDLLCGFFVAGQACVFDSVYKHAWRETSPLYCIVLALKLLYVLASY